MNRLLRNQSRSQYPDFLPTPIFGPWQDIYKLCECKIICDNFNYDGQIWGSESGTFNKAIKNIVLLCCF